MSSGSVGGVGVSGDRDGARSHNVGASMLVSAALASDLICTMNDTEASAAFSFPCLPS
jgi:hypothetical protein